MLRWNQKCVPKTFLHYFSIWLCRILTSRSFIQKGWNFPDKADRKLSGEFQRCPGNSKISSLPKKYDFCTNLLTIRCFSPLLVSQTPCKESSGLLLCYLNKLQVPQPVVLSLVVIQVPWNVLLTVKVWPQILNFSEFCFRLSGNRTS